MSKHTDAALALRDMLDDCTDDYTATAIQLNVEGQTIVAAQDEHGDMLWFIVKQAPVCGVCEQPPVITDDATLVCDCGDWPGRWDA